MDNDILRLRNRLDEVRVFRTRSVRPLEDATFRAPGKAAVSVALGDPWPSLEYPATFAFEARVPSAGSDSVRVLLNVGGEALLTVDGAAIGGLNPNHREYDLTGLIQPGDTARIEAEAVPFGPFGSAHHRPYLRAASLLHVDPGADRLWRELLAVHSAADAVRSRRPELARRLIDVLQEALASVPIPRWPSEAYLAQMAPEFRTRATPNEGGFVDLWERWSLDSPEHEPDEALARAIRDATRCARSAVADLRSEYPPEGRLTMVGHTHIDLAWLWPLDETRRKIRRSFATVLHLMERDPSFTFGQASPQVYGYLEEDDPAMFGAVRRRVQEGRWELLGGMWVEPDGNLPSGESWVRQLLHGQRYFQDRFGRTATVGWLPDTFGYAGNLPQLFRGAGLTGFFTTKLTWNETNPFPHDLYAWEGIDGSRIPAHSFRNPEGGYNGPATAESLLATWENFGGKRHHSASLYTFGYGDGGGGPTEGMLHRAEAYRDFPGMPRTEHGSVASFFEDVDEDRLPTWVGEKYLEFHRATYTAQARVKSLNRKLELALVEAETASVLARELADFPYPHERLHEAWTALLRNQFHDILPGSSVYTVYQTAEDELERSLEQAQAMRAEALAAAAERVGNPSGERRIVVWNLGLHDRPLELAVELEGDEQVEPTTDGGTPLPFELHGRTLVLASDDVMVPGIGYRTVYLRGASDGGGRASGEASRSDRLTVGADPDSAERPLHATDALLENAYLRVEIGPDGTIHRLYDKQAAREVLASRGNQIWVHPDVPANFDAWDIDASYDSEGEEWTADAPPKLVRSGPVEAAIRVERTGYGSQVAQEYVLTASARRVEVRTTIDWRARRTLLRARFPVAVRSHEAWYETAFGAVPRPTYRNTSWDAAQFEVPGHRWADLSEGDYGVSLLTTDKYGFATRDNVMSVTLLTSSVHPDPWADEGRHETTYALFPHTGTWRTGTLRQAEALNAPMQGVQVAGTAETSTPSLPTTAKLLGVDAEAVALAALKASEDGEGVVLRVYEAHGTRGEAGLEGRLCPSTLAPTNILEGAVSDPDHRDPAFEYRPFQVRSFRMRLGSGRDEDHERDMSSA